MVLLLNWSTTASAQRCSQSSHGASFFAAALMEWQETFQTVLHLLQRIQYSNERDYIHWILHLIPTSVSNILNIKEEIALECIIFLPSTHFGSFEFLGFFLWKWWRILYHRKLINGLIRFHIKENIQKKYKYLNSFNIWIYEAHLCYFYYFLFCWVILVFLFFNTSSFTTHFTMKVIKDFEDRTLLQLF